MFTIHLVTKDNPARSAILKLSLYDLSGYFLLQIKSHHQFVNQNTSHSGTLNDPTQTKKRSEMAREPKWRLLLCQYNVISN